jgi:hypothetical protein
MKINKLPGRRGSFPAKTEKKTTMFVYQINGNDEEIALYHQAKEAEGYTALVDDEYGVLYTTAINLGREAELEVYTDKNGMLKISGFNKDLKEIDELRSAGISQATVDSKIIEALTKGRYATKRVVVEEPAIAEPATETAAE